MRICAVTQAYQEPLLEQWHRHYKAQGVCELMVTHDILPELDDMKKTGTMLAIMKTNADRFDYFICADADELLVPIRYATLKEMAEKEPKDFYCSKGFNMVAVPSDLPYDPDQYLTDQRKHGFEWEPESKVVMYKSGYEPSVNVAFHPNIHSRQWDSMGIPDVLLLHYVAFDHDISLARRKRNGNRVGPINTARGHGVGNVGHDDEWWEEWLRSHWSNPNIVQVIP